MKVDGGTLILCLKQPENLLNLDPYAFSSLARLAQHELLLARLAGETEKHGVMPRLAPVMQEVFKDAAIAAEASQKRMRFEVDRIRRALLDYDGPVILLKGLAYLATGLEGSAGRFCSDVDILVPRERLDEVEALLRARGWHDIKYDAYDDAYYRKWMHELPPLRHEKRGVIIDVHHAILPLTARLKPSSKHLIEKAKKSDWPRFHILSENDRILHCAAHAFHDGDLSGGIRNLFDFYDLLKSAKNFSEDKLCQRAIVLNLERPLAYALRYLRRILDVDDYVTLEREMRHHLPITPVLKGMDYLVDAVLLQSDPWRVGDTGAAKFALYIRSHWLRMPPALLARHLWMKFLKRRSP